MNYDRYFLFGCSWTKYYWPSWADIIKYATDKPVYNWGRPGIGNVGIFCRLVECDLKYKFTERDAIIVQWTNWTREDRYINGWKAYGNVFNNPFYDDSFAKKYWSWDNDVIKNATTILTANKAYRINYQFNMLPYLTKEAGYEPDISDNGINLAEFYNQHLPNLESWPISENSQFKGTCIDPHPDIRNHLYFYNNYIKTKFPLELGSEETRLNRLFLRISQKLNKSMTYNETQDTVMRLVKQFDPNFSFNNEGF